MQKIREQFKTKLHGDYEIVFDVFDSELEFQDTLLKYSQEYSDFFYDFERGYGQHTFKTQMRKLQNGDTSFVETFNKILLKNKKVLSSGEIERSRLVASRQGYMPNVSAVLSNNPKCFYRSQTKEIKTPIVNVYYDIVCSHNVAAEEREKALSALLLKICELEKNGYRVRINVLYAAYHFTPEKRIDGFCYVLKKENEKMNITRLTYPLVRTDFFRGLGFAWYRSFCFENLLRRLFAYGRPLYGERELQNCLLRLLKKKNEKVVYVNMHTNLDSLIEEIKKGE